MTRLLAMDWRHICFAHWRVDAELLRAYAPPGWEVDLHDGAAWLSVVPFVMEHIKAGPFPVLPGFHSVLELNLRTYMRRGDLRAVYFFSLDAASRLMVTAARITTGLPYLHANMSLEHNDTHIRYESVRAHRGMPPGAFRATYRSVGPPAPAKPGSIEEFLHERYRFVTRKNLLGSVFHDPYRLEPAEINIEENTLGTLIDYSFSQKPDICYYVRSLAVAAAYG